MRKPGAGRTVWQYACRNAAALVGESFDPGAQHARQDGALGRRRHEAAATDEEHPRC
jgi:hypothetical protein